MVNCSEVVGKTGGFFATLFSVNKFFYPLRAICGCNFKDVVLN